MSTSIRYLGAAAFEIVGPRHRLLIDPFLSGNPASPIGPDDVEAPDLILVTHAAYDHLGDAAAIARRTGAPVVCGGDVRWLLLDDGVPPQQIQATVWGVVVEVGGISVRPVECHHWSMSVRKNGQVLSGVPLAFIVKMEPGISVYHYGDTSYFDMRFVGELYSPTVALLGCTTPRELTPPDPQAGVFVTGEMDADEAARVAEMLGVEVAVACHYLSFDDQTAAFPARVAEHDSTGRRRAVVPRPGDVIRLEPEPSSQTVRVLT